MARPSSLDRWGSPSHAVPCMRAGVGTRTSTKLQYKVTYKVTVTAHQKVRVHYLRQAAARVQWVPPTTGHKVLLRLHMTSTHPNPHVGSSHLPAFNSPTQRDPSTNVISPARDALIPPQLPNTSFHPFPDAPPLVYLFLEPPISTSARAGHTGPTIIQPIYETGTGAAQP